MVPQLPSQPVWQGAGGVLCQRFCHIASCPPGESCWASQPLGLTCVDVTLSIPT